jgi:hypothetical protein
VARAFLETKRRKKQGVEYDGTKIGDHELKAIRLKINDFSTKIEE